MKPYKILITGANGQLGQALQSLASDFPNAKLIPANRTTFSVTDTQQMKAFLAIHKPDFCINCAAYTAVDKAETELELAHLINQEAVANLASLCFENNIKLIHISTDYVFDGNSETPITEEMPTAPINVYGKTKFLGEQACLEKHPNSIIIRTAWVYSEFGNNFVKTMLRLMQERNSINVINDQIGAPTYATDLAQAILTIINQKVWKSGIYHYANEGKISWYQFAQAIQEMAKLDCSVLPINTNEYPTAAQRPLFSLLNTQKIKQTFQLNIPHYKISLEKCIAAIKLTNNQV